MKTEYLAGYKSSFRDTGKAHACDRSSRLPRPYNTGGYIYESLCGQKYLDCNGQRFTHIIHFDQCQRCVQIMEKQATTAETAGLAAAIATLAEWKDSLPDGHPEKVGAIRAIEVLQVYGPRVTR